MHFDIVKSISFHGLEAVSADQRSWPILILLGAAHDHSVDTF